MKLKCVAKGRMKERIRKKARINARTREKNGKMTNGRKILNRRKKEIERNWEKDIYRRKKYWKVLKKWQRERERDLNDVARKR